MSEGDDAYDVAVVGGGGTGLMAAYAAAQTGASVILLEKGNELGGTTALSVGTLTASGTRLQRKAGIEDTTDAHFEDMEKFAGPLAARDNPELRRILTDNVCETIRILETLGIVFMGPLPEPPHRHPRMHAIIPHSKGFIRQLAKACRRRNVLLRTGAKVEKLVLDAGRVRGVELQKGECITARRAVILATGDFSAASRDYKSVYMSGPLLKTPGINSLSTGDGQAMGVAAGGEVINGDLAWGPEIRFKAPPKPSLVSNLPAWPVLARLILFAMKIIPQALMRRFLLGFVTTFLAPSLQPFAKGAILIDGNGRRFCDERNRPQDDLPVAADNQGWIVFGAEVAEQFRAYPNFISTAPGVGYADLTDYERSRPDIVRKAGSLEQLAAVIRVPEDALVRSVAGFNEALKDDDERAPIAKPPFYALGPVHSWIVFSEGGLAVDERLRVLTKEGEPISGLYAAGSAGQGGLILEGHGHHLSWAFTSGRLAGSNAALDGEVEG